MSKKICIVIPAYNAGKKIVSVFERIPADIWSKNPQFIIVNDGSSDDTSAKIQEIKSRWSGVEVVDKSENQGYTRAQRDGFLKALSMGADIAVLLHADGQYAPEMLPQLLRPLEDGTADIVQGSRMMDKKAALKGGMPFYKFVANVGLSGLENLVYRLNFAEYHSGYMLYSRKALETIPFVKLSERARPKTTDHFDGEMMLVGAKKGLIIKEIPIPTYYGDEVSHVKPISYGFLVLGIMLKYLFGKYDL